MVSFTHFRLVAPAAVILALLMAGLATIPYFAVVRLDAAVRERQEALVKRNISIWIDEVEFALTAWTIWDEPIAKLDNSFDLEWAERNIGSSLIGTSRTRFVAILNSNDDLIYAKTASEVADRAFFKRDADEIVNDAGSLVDLVRAAEDRLKKPGIPDPLSFSKIEIIGDDSVLLTASLFQPDFGLVKPLGKHAPILVSAIPIAGSLQAFLGDRFLLDDAVVGPRHLVSPDRARVEIAVGSDGQSQTLSWKPNTPARDLLWQSMPVIVTVAVLFVAGAIFSIRISRRALQRLVEAEQRMRHAATHDFLTGLANRSLVLSEFERLVPDGKLAIACLDLDGFKAINDRHGHADGDELLKQVAQRLLLGCRENDVVFRLGGDEFAVLMPGLSPEEAKARCHGLVANLAKSYLLREAVVTVGASFGVSEVREGERDPEEVFRRADEALYRAKSSARTSTASSGEAADQLRLSA